MTRSFLRRTSAALRRASPATVLRWVLAVGVTGIAFAWPGLTNVVPGLAAAAATVIWLARRARGATLTVLVNLAGVVLVLEGFEVYSVFAYKSAHPTYDLLVADDHATYFRSDPELGYRATENVKARARMYVDRTPAYDVVYTIDSYGLRAHPDGHPDSPTAVLFFGCSYVFGEGVNDDETLPYQFESLDPAHRRALNFALHGYGPHHMLALLQAGRESAALRGSRPQYGVYLALSDHVRRVAGRASWDAGGPRFVLLKDGRLSRRPLWEQRARQDGYTFFANSRFASHLLDLTLFRTDPMVASRSELELYLEVVTQSAHDFEQRYPGARFVVVLDDGIGAASAWPPWLDVASALRERGLTVLQAVDLMPACHDDPAMSIARDGHPSPFANRLLARALVQRLTP